jgi:hypothetical protein
MQVLQLTNSKSVVHCRREGDAGTDYQVLAIRKGTRLPNILPPPPFFPSIIVCRLYKITLSDQAQVTLKLRVSLFDLV